MPTYRTLAARCEHEIDKIKGSRFIAWAAPTPTPAAAEELVAEARDAYSDARHHCWAYRTGEAGAVFRSSDDGEPSGSAGRPILQQIDSAELTGVAVVVVRYFGGTKLGVGGLMRAYGAAAAACLERATVTTVVVTRRVAFEYPYECTSAVEAQLKSYELEPRASDYGENVRCSLDVPAERVQAFLDDLNESTAGRLNVLERET